MRDVISLGLPVPNRGSRRSGQGNKKGNCYTFVADIHFDYRLALTCITGGVDKIRLNPAILAGSERVRIGCSRLQSREAFQ